MKPQSLKIPAIIIAIGLILSLVVCLLTNIVRAPAVTEHAFRYSVTYELCGETKTLEGIYKCSFDGYSAGENPRDRYYSGEYIVDGQSTLSHSYTIAEKDGGKLYIVTVLDAWYLMNDQESVEYDTFLEEPYLEAVDAEGYSYEDGEMPSEFAAEIISWEYPEPVENDFVFAGFSIMHTGSMLATLAVGLLTIVACLIFVKRDKTVLYEILDKLSVAVNFVVSILGIPFITICVAFFPLSMSTDTVWYQIFLCVPAFAAFTVAASIALRRKGFTKTGFFVQFAGPVLFFVLTAITNYLG